MSKKITDSNGEEVEVDEVKVVDEKEIWNMYKLDDGNTIEIKNVLMSLVKAKGKVDNNGKPIYLFTLTPMARVS